MPPAKVAAPSARKPAKKATVPAVLIEAAPTSIAGTSAARDGKG